MSKQSKRARLWDNLDRVWEHPDDVPYPEGAEIPSEKFEQIAELQKREHRKYMETCNDFKNNPLTVI